MGFLKEAPLCMQLFDDADETPMNQMGLSVSKIQVDYRTGFHVKAFNKKRTSTWGYHSRLESKLETQAYPLGYVPCTASCTCALALRVFWHGSGHLFR